MMYSFHYPPEIMSGRMRKDKRNVDGMYIH